MSTQHFSGASQSSPDAFFLPVASGTNPARPQHDIKRFLVACFSFASLQLHLFTESAKEITLFFLAENHFQRLDMYNLSGHTTVSFFYFIFVCAGFVFSRQHLSYRVTSLYRNTKLLGTTVYYDLSKGQCSSSDSVYNCRGGWPCHIATDD